jgi:hypothetical protein
VTLAIGAAARAVGPSGRLRFQFATAPDPAQLDVSVNGVALARGTASGTWLELDLAAGVLRSDANEITVALASGAPALSWTDLHCRLPAIAAP